VSQGTMNDIPMEQQEEQNLATFAGGCFWCTEAVFRRVRGVRKATSGYIGGTAVQPTYEQVINGKTGHAEAVEVTFDPMSIPYERLVEIFFATHDPTTLNRQGADVGTQYRSVIFYHTESQRRTAEGVLDRLEHEHAYDRPVVTQILRAGVFYPAEEKHQNFFAKNTSKPYCQIVINPKIAKLRRKFASDVETEGAMPA
jgi:peptide-methionine (S)-S-oxide reductase